MEVNRTENDTIVIELDGEAAEALQTVLGVVADNTANQTLDRLFTLLDARTVIAAKRVDFLPDLNYDPEEPFGHETVLTISDLA